MRSPEMLAGGKWRWGGGTAHHTQLPDRPDNAMWTTGLLVCAHGNQGVHRDGTTNGDETRKSGDHHEEDGSSQEGDGIRLLHSVEHTADEFCPRPCREQ